MKNTVFILLFLFCRANSVCAQNITVNFQPSFHNARVTLADSTFKTLDSLEIETFKCYISGIEFLKNKKSVWQEENSFHLLDASDKKTMQIHLKAPSGLQFDQIKFNLGIDSIINTSGILGGDLDPAKGMYWAWQSGYINLKLEGKSPKCPARKNEFQFHLGGYLPPNNPLQTIVLNTTTKKAIDISIKLEILFSSINLTDKNHIMSPCSEAVLLSAIAAKMFQMKQ